LPMGKLLPVVHVLGAWYLDCVVSVVNDLFA
jgi:hypothetical protein